MGISVVKSIKLRVTGAQYNKGRFPEEYTDKNPMGLIQGKAFQEMKKGAFPFGSNIIVDLTPYDADGNEIGPDRVVAEGIAFFPKYGLTFTGEDGSTETGSVVGRGSKGGVGGEISAIPGKVNIGGERYDASNGYTLRVHVDGEGTTVVSAELAGITDSVSFRTS